MRARILTAVGGLAAATAIGAAIRRLFDSDQGQQRRHRLREQVTAGGRRVTRTVRRRAKRGEGELEGLFHRLTPARHGDEPVDDHTMVAKVRSQVLGKEPYRGYALTVDAADGVVTVRGEIGDPETAQAIIEEIEALPEVESVESLVHEPGTPAPNKEAALNAG